MKLVLFDIDGTLLWSDGAGRRAMERALTETFGSSGPAGHRYDGKTDRQIVREAMRHAGHGDPHIDERMETLLERYLAGLGLELESGARLRPLGGVPELLDALEARDNVVLGLLTGNLARGAEVKLRAVGLDPSRFRVCAFGSDHEARLELPAVAQRRAREALGIEVGGESIVVIGDTPADIECCRAVGAKAIGVATGRYSMDELRAHHPIAVFPDLRDTRAVLRAMLDA